MIKQYIIVVDTPSNIIDDEVNALMRLGFFMIEDNIQHPEVKIQYKDAIDNANNPDD
jgi:hypothetical protein